MHTRKTIIRLLEFRICLFMFLLHTVLLDFFLCLGLKVNYIRELHKGVQEIFNPFPTIAVWAAVKFVHKKEQDR